MKTILISLMLCLAFTASAQQYKYLVFKNKYFQPTDYIRQRDFVRIRCTDKSTHKGPLSIISRDSIAVAGDTLAVADIKRISWASPRGRTTGYTVVAGGACMFVAGHALMLKGISEPGLHIESILAGTGLMFSGVICIPVGLIVAAGNAKQVKGNRTLSVE